MGFMKCEMLTMAMGILQLAFLLLVGMIQECESIKIRISRNLNTIPSYSPVNVTDLDFSSNNFSIIKPGDFRPSPTINNIILRSSLIQIILDGVFNGMDNLMSLDLEDNLLISMPALDDVMDTLGSLNLMKNKIKEVPNNYFDNFTSLHSLSIQENEISTLPPDSVRALDFFHAFDFHGNKIEALECGTFARMSRLEYVTMYHNWLSSFPCFGVIHEDARITSIDLNSNEISQITEDEVSHLIYLRYLDLNYNMISNGSFIKAIPSLRVIRMTHNRMVSLLTIDSMIPRPVPLQDMVEVWVDSNNLVEFPCISALAQYSEISLHSNYLHIYPPRCLAGLSNCSHLYLGNNKATEFPDFSLLFQNTLQVLELHENDISSVPLAHIQNLRSLRRLTLHNNDIPVLPDMTFAVETLTDFDIDNNNLQDLDPVLADYGVWKIGDWDIDHNDITYILQDLLHQMKSLYRLNAYMNKLTDLPHLTAVGKTLTWATFKHNKISHIPTGSLSGMVVLEYLNLEYNLIALFPFEMIGSMPRLRSLHLGHNKLTTVPYLSHLPEKAGLVVTIYNNYIECTKDICWMRNFDKFGLLRETYLCKDHPVFSSHVFNDLTDDQMDCYYVIELSFHLDYKFGFMALDKILPEGLVMHGVRVPTAEECILHCIGRMACRRAKVVPHLVKPSEPDKPGENCFLIEG